MNLGDRIKQGIEAAEDLNYNFDEIKKHSKNIQQSVFDLIQYVKKNINKIDSIEIILKQETWPEIASLVIDYCRKHYL